MEFQVLGSDNVKQYIEYLKTAMAKEPEMMTADMVDEEGILERIQDPFYLKTTSVLAVENGKVVGRIEYHFFGCMQDGYRMAYVDWVYVLPEYRHQGRASGNLRRGRGGGHRVARQEDCGAARIRRRERRNERGRA